MIKALYHNPNPLINSKYTAINKKAHTFDAPIDLEKYWVDAVLTANYLINRMPSFVLKGKKPFSILFPKGTPFSLAPNIFGCICYVHDHGSRHNKLDPCAIRCFFLGVLKSLKRVFLTHHRYFICADVTFNESSPFFAKPTCNEPESVNLVLDPFESSDTPILHLQWGEHRNWVPTIGSEIVSKPSVSKSESI
ncbi:LOW QUALITY PROTEIN: hypothetical protein OSB04_029379 [Centaurea solstitialis]|uniref:Retroviral polymerase SH3-like domain-containing protein n=1 Tax=Centaurea solstitialis TaxID=347529 RepID=A0AA38T297_9ASTR|nr:LOW QUALITY PROTEIN: hypothetical protein OSB04_029379 [Centaurea solstitialis]